jgi:hypothetical protein
MWINAAFQHLLFDNKIGNAYKNKVSVLITAHNFSSIKLYPATRLHLTTLPETDS